MRPLSFDPPALRKHLLRHKIATLPELKAALGTSADLTVFRKLKLLDYLSSYTHRGRYYALREAARFDDVGLWSHDAVWVSRYGTLVSTIQSFVNQSPSGWFADELADVLHAEVQDPLHDLVRAERLCRSEVAGRFLYTSADGRQARDQLRTRQTAQAVPLLTDASALQVSADEQKRPSCFSTACSTSSSVVCSPGWNPSSWDTVAMAFWPNSSAWTRTPSLADANNSSIRTYRQAARSVPAADANQSKKNRRHRHADRVPARIRHRWRSHHRAEVVSAYYGEDCHGVGRLRCQC